jgi:hypothetical protein
MVQQNLTDYLAKKKKDKPTLSDEKDLLRTHWQTKIEKLFKDIEQWLEAEIKAELLQVKYSPFQMQDHQGRGYTLDRLLIILGDGSQIELTPGDGRRLYRETKWPVVAFGIIDVLGPCGQDELVLVSTNDSGPFVSIAQNPFNPLEPSYLASLYQYPGQNQEQVWTDLCWKVITNRSLGTLKELDKDLWSELIIRLTDPSALPDMREQAQSLAQANKDAEPSIRKIFWFPSEEEIRLVEIEADTLHSESGKIEAFYFGPSPLDNLFKPCAIAIIHPDEERAIELPQGWGTWEQAEELTI